MEKVSKFLTLDSMLLLLAMVISGCVAHNHRISPSAEAVEEWFKTLPNAKEKLTKLHFYFHDVVSGKNPTSITVAQHNSTAASPTVFGLINVMDDALTAGPKSDSKIVGWARGIFASSSLEEVDFLMTLSFVFISGEYNGSTLSVVAHNQILHKYREMPVVGGTGVFRLARGVATAETVWFNATTKDAVVEYTVMVLHYY